MAPAQDLQVVLGAAGGIGGAVVRELAARGHAVRAVTRDGRAGLTRGVLPVAADLATAEGAAAACKDAAVVYHCAQPPYGTDSWLKRFPALNASIVDAAAGAGAKLVCADNLYMYGPLAGPITEATSERPASAKGGVRLRLSDALLEAHQAGRLRVAIGRASDYFGPGGDHSIAGMLISGAIAGKAVRWPASGDQPHTFAYLPDVARALVTLGERSEADGRAWVPPSAAPVTAREFVALVEPLVGRPVKLSVTSKLMMRLAGLVVREAREVPDIWYQFAAPFVVDGAAFDAAFGPLVPTSLEAALRETIAWYRRPEPAAAV